MMDPKDAWNEIYSKPGSAEPDDWLEKYSERFPANGVALDIGCGSGCNIPFLKAHCAEVYAIDYAEEAIKAVKGKWDVHALVHDMRDAFPFADNRFDLVLADLSLHYFPIDQTKSILREIHRVVKGKGILIGRVNSTFDVNHGAMKGIEIERNYYRFEGKNKRFFDKNMIEAIFTGAFRLLIAKEAKTYKYGDEKAAWEFIAERTEKRSHETASP